MSDEEIIKVIEDYSKENWFFNNSFIETVRENFEKNGELTSGVRCACKNIIERFKINYD